MRNIEDSFISFIMKPKHGCAIFYDRVKVLSQAVTGIIIEYRAAPKADGETCWQWWQQRDRANRRWVTREILVEDIRELVVYKS